jgi:hypothetical protein
LLALLASGTAAADHEPLAAVWASRRGRLLEVGRHEVEWRERIDRAQGILAGIRFTAPRDRDTVWRLANDYAEIGRKTPGIRQVAILERQPNRQVLQVDVKVLWKEVSLRFDVEQSPPAMIRFRWLGGPHGTYEGLCLFEPAEAGEATQVRLSTRLQLARRVPARLLLTAERVMMLHAARAFLDSLDPPQRPQ